ncbi:MAG: peptidylprolyl isomerase [Burkholderiales bacterium]|nr:peptidylprolyl isomerase [Burkholderiales bacterium]
MRTSSFSPLLNTFALAACLALSLPQSVGAATPSVVADSIAVVVNDEVITKLELETRLRSVENRLKKQKVELPPRADLQRQLLERMIVERAQLQLAKENGIRIDDIMLDRAILRLAEQNKMGVQAFRDQLEKEGYTFAAFREEIRDEIAMQRLREHEVESKIQISESELENYFAEQALHAKSTQEFNLAQILVRVPENASSEQIAARRAKAEDVLRQLRLGAEFNKISATYSDSADALSGGEIGWRNLDRLPQLFVDAVQDLKEGQISAIVKSPNGFHIIKVLGKRSQTQDAAAGSVQQTHARHILIRVNQVVSNAEARRKLADIKERLKNKAAKFEDLARQFSNDGSASKGGDLGWLYPGDTLPEFEAAMNKLPLGEVSEPVETNYGLHLIEVLERKSDDVSKERQKQIARTALRERKMEEATEDWLRQLRDRAYVEYRTDDKPASDKPANDKP